MEDLISDSVTSGLMPLGESLLRIGAVDWQHDLIKVFLATRKGRPDRIGSKYAEASKYEVQRAVGYARGGAVLTGKYLQYAESPFPSVDMMADPVTWYDCDLTARFAYIYNESLPGAPLLAFVNFGFDVVSCRGWFCIKWDRGGNSVIHLP